MSTEQLRRDDARLTPQRRAVLGVLRASADHPTAAEVFERVRALSPGIGAATVYRSLGHLVTAGYATELSFERRAARYDANTTRHDHLVCDRCGRAVDIDVPFERIDPAADAEVNALAARVGFTVTAYDLRLRGHCADCVPTSTPHP
jgi:Fe2+ or Zn2+ uptake regulation protein